MRLGVLRMAELKISHLSVGEVSLMAEKCLKLLEVKGVKVNHPEALKLLDSAGALVDFESRQVRFPVKLVETALSKLPAGFRLAGGSSDHDLPLPNPGGGFYLRTNTGANNYLDPETRACRDLTLADLAHWGRLVEVMEQVDFCPFPFPNDVPPGSADVHALKTLLENTSKHIWVQPYSLESIPYLFELASAAASPHSLEEKPLISLIACSLTPLEFKAMDLEVIIRCCRQGVPIQACSLPSAGGTSPITIAGTVLLAASEVLAMAVMAQLIRPGTPVIGTPLIFTLDMQSGKALQSSAEAVLGAAGAVRVIKHAFGLPTHTYGSGSDSPVPDGQSMIERTLQGMMVAGSGADILGGAGQLDVATAVSPVQLVIDNDLAAILKRMVRGVEVSDETLNWEDLLDTPPGGHFLERMHTLRHCREAVRPRTFLRAVREIWQMEGGKDLYARALERLNDLQRDLRPRDLLGEVSRDLGRIVRQADEILNR